MILTILDQQPGFGHVQSPSQSTFSGLGADRGKYAERMNNALRFT